MATSQSGGGDGKSRLVVPTVVETIVRELRDLITAGEFAPGQPLREEHLAERFGVSRPPLREALRILQRDGIVVGQARHGFTVIPITNKDAYEIYTLRWILEREAVKIAIPVSSPEQLQPLRDALDLMRDVADRSGTDAQAEMVKANAKFHMAVVRLAGNARMSAAYASLQMQVKLCMAMNLAVRQHQYGDPHDVVDRHASLLALIEKGDLPTILGEMERHGDRSFLDTFDSNTSDD